MKLSVKHTARHKGETLELDSELETMTVITPTGEKRGPVSWEAVIDYIDGYVEKASPKRVRNHPRSALAVKVNYQTPHCKRVDSITGEIGGGGVFIESVTPASVGDEIAMELVLPDNPMVPVQAKGTVAWVRPRPEHYTFYSGMGVQFTEISEPARARLLEMIRSLARSRQGSSNSNPDRP